MNIFTTASLALFVLASAAFAQVSEHADAGVAVAEEASAFEEVVEIGEDGVETKLRKPRCARREVTPRGCVTCGDCGKNYITKMDFYHVKPVLEGAGKNWSYFYGANDGHFSADCHGGFIEANPYTQFFTTDGLFRNNIKFAMASDTLADVPKNADLVLEYEASVEVFNTDQSPYPKEITEVNDFRLGFGFFLGYDPMSGLVNAWFLTNDRVYAVYCRLANYFDLPNSTWAKFTFVIPVGMRKPCDKHNLKTIYHGDKKQVSYRLEGKEVLRITKPGYYIDRDYLVVEEGGIESGVFPSKVLYGFGAGDYLTAYPACKRSDTCCDCQYPSVRMALAYIGNRGGVADLVQYNPVVGQPVPASYWYSNPTGTPSPNEEMYYLWGQGADVHIEKLLVYQDFCSGRKC
jgi:hypothetical protein